MIHELTQPQRWSTRRWWTLIASVFAGQIGLIFWLGKPQPNLWFGRDISPTLRLVAGPRAATQLALRDPTLFALPHRESFSGPAWLTIPVREFPAYAWSEPSRLLTLSKDVLGADYVRFMATNQVNELPAFTDPELDARVPIAAGFQAFSTPSRLRLAGALAGRHLLVRPDLPPWPSAEILTNSVVQLVVLADGNPLSPTLLRSSGSTDADQWALREARAARFEPLRLADPLDPLAGLVWVQMIFEWQTLPLPPTNTVTEPGPR